MPNNQSPQQPVLSVSELNQYAKGVLEMHVGKVWVQGEISNFSRPASGHWYFTLKDNNAQIRCAMFRNKNQFIRTRVENGMQVLLQGSVTLYPQRGDYQLIADYLEESGIGALQRQFELLKNKLAKEGLFNQTHKKALPRTPKHLGIITSASGAALHDMLTVTKTRFPALPITLIPAAVQGDQSTVQLIEALNRATQWNQENTDNPIDVLILGRGGGSIEDLWSFNEEALARAIHACSIPIISAVGHETDVTIADHVADVRAPTPSAAAEMVTPDFQHITQQLDFAERQLIRTIENQLHKHRQKLAEKKQRLIHPGDRIKNYRNAFENLRLRLEMTESAQLNRSKQTLEALSHRLQQQSPESDIQTHNKALADLHNQLHQQMKHTMESRKQQLHTQVDLLDAVSPLATLKRGYAILQTDEKQVIKKTQDVTAGDKIRAKLIDGEIHCQVL